MINVQSEAHTCVMRFNAFLLMSKPTVTRSPTTCSFTRNSNKNAMMTKNRQTSATNIRLSRLLWTPYPRPYRINLEGWWLKLKWDRLTLRRELAPFSLTGWAAPFSFGESVGHAWVTPLHSALCMSLLYCCLIGYAAQWRNSYDTGDVGLKVTCRFTLYSPLKMLRLGSSRTRSGLRSLASRWEMRLFRSSLLILDTTLVGRKWFPAGGQLCGEMWTLLVLGVQRLPD